LRGTAEGGKRHAVADENTEVADAMRPPAALDHALDVMRSRSASLKLEHVPVSNSGEGLPPWGCFLPCVSETLPLELPVVFTLMHDQGGQLHVCHQTSNADGEQYLALV